MSQHKDQNATALIKRIREFHKDENRGDKKLSLISFSEKCGLHRNTLNRLYDIDFNPTANTIDAMIKYMESV